MFTIKNTFRQNHEGSMNVNLKES